MLAAAPAAHGYGYPGHGYVAAHGASHAYVSAHGAHHGYVAAGPYAHGAHLAGPVGKKNVVKKYMSKNVCK